MASVWDFLSGDAPPEFGLGAEEDPQYTLGADLTLPTLEIGSPAPVAAPAYTSIFDSIISEQQKTYSNLDAELDRLREKRTELISSPTNDWGAVWGSVLPGLGAALAGGSIGDIASSAAAGGNTYIKAADERNKQALAGLEKDISETAASKSSADSLLRSLQVNQASADAQQSLSRKKGELIGTPEYDKREEDAATKAERQQEAIFKRQQSLQDEKLDRPVSEKVKGLYGFKPEDTVTERDIEAINEKAKTEATAGRVQDQKEQRAQMLAGIVAPGGKVDPEAPINKRAQERLGIAHENALKFISDAERVKAALARGSQMTDEDRAAVGAALASMAEARIKMGGAGASLTGNEISIYIDRYLPQILNSPTFSIRGAALDELMGLSGKGKLDAATEQVKNSMATMSLMNRTYFDAYAPQYQKMTDQELARYGLDRQRINSVLSGQARGGSSRLDMLRATLAKGRQNAAN